MDHSLDTTIALLRRTPPTLTALLGDLPEAWTQTNEGPDTWTVSDVVAHLIHCERTDWMPRARHILAHGQSRPFPPFDRFGHVRESEGKTLPQLLQAFAHIREVNLSDLVDLHLQPADFERLGTHPALGPVTLAQLLAAWAAHDLTHLHQLSRILAHQLQQAVGPFQRFLGVMQCTGHSAPA